MRQTTCLTTILIHNFVTNQPTSQTPNIHQETDQQEENHQIKYVASAIGQVTNAPVMSECMFMTFYIWNPAVLHNTTQYCEYFFSFQSLEIAEAFEFQEFSL